jgi:serine/threonine-protein phosphatase 2A regulatory subunit A
MAEKLEKFLPLVGGSEYAHLLIPLFQALCDIEEVSVRNAAATSCRQILKQLGPQNKVQVAAYFELIKQLSNEESGEIFYSRSSACLILVDLYSLLSDADKVILREIYGRLCKDEMPLVRRVGALALIPLSLIINDQEILTTEFLPLLKSLINDESQMIQTIGVENMANFCLLLKKFGNAQILSSEFLPLVKNLCDDQSWRIRQSLSRGYRTFAQTFSAVEVSTDIFPALLHMVLDPEPEVRTLAVQEILHFLDFMDHSQFTIEFASVASQLVDDPMSQVRKLLSELCISVAAKIGAELVNSHLADLTLKLLNDDDPLVRLRIIKKISVIAEEVPTLLSRMTETLKSFFSHTNWRLRKGLMESMPSIVKHLGQEFFVEHFLNGSLLLVKDGFEEVRTAASAAMAEICKISDAGFVYERIFPVYKNLASEDYLTRLTMVTALQGFLSSENIHLHHKFQADVINQLLAATNDKVPNVRLKAAQALHSVLTSGGSSNFNQNVKDQMESALRELQNDKDKDVRYFASFRSRH